MIAHHYDFIGNGPVDDTDNIPQWLNVVILLVDKVDREAGRGWADVVMHALVAKATALPVIVELGSIRSVAIERFE